jgi:hypothetical protein
VVVRDNPVPNENNHLTRRLEFDPTVFTYAGAEMGRCLLSRDICPCDVA